MNFTDVLMLHDRKECRQDKEIIIKLCYFETISWYVNDSGHNRKQENRNLKCSI